MNRYEARVFGREFVIFARSKKAASRTGAFHYWLLFTHFRRGTV